GVVTRTGGDVSPDLPSSLIAAALKNSPLPMTLLATCLRRLQVEGGPFRFRAARMGLIRSILNRDPNRGDFLMPEALRPAQTPQPHAYACGKLLAFLARCQKPRSFGTDAPILERYYGAASTSPRAVFPVLLRMNRYHLAG